MTHEQLIDLTWKDSIVPLLLSRYPGLTPAELDRARAYAYGGCVIQDIGYYPFGDRGFSNLTHYVRSGDFVVSLLRNAQNANELAFAIGALSHYIGDSIGHAGATNLAVPVEFPALGAKYGSVVNYAEGKHQHVQTEFAFDINEISHHRMAPIGYLRHIGLGVPQRQLGLAYYQTYGLRESFGLKRGRRFNIGGYRFAVRLFLPRVAYAITILRRNREPADANSPDVLELDKEATRVANECDWQLYRRHAGIGTYTLAALLFVLPKIGPLSMADVKGPTPDTDAEYVHSVLTAESTLRTMLARFTPPVGIRPVTKVLSGTHERDPRHPLPNLDLDTGRPTQPGGYSLTDLTFASLLRQLARRPADPIPPGIKRDIEDYYANPTASNTLRQDPRKWAQVQEDLSTLSKMPVSTEPEPYPTYGADADEEVP
jgi:hypothetical protein